jgi:hypothetical protein
LRLNVPHNRRKDTSMPSSFSTLDPRTLAAKKWGKAHGYYGAQGGWIYNAKHKPVAQGWSHFANVMARKIAQDEFSADLASERYAHSSGLGEC